MHDELVKRLREAAEYVPCIMDREDAIKAADAIEELNCRIDRAIELYNRNIEKTAMYEALVGISQEPPKEE